MSSNRSSVGPAGGAETRKDTSSPVNAWETAAALLSASVDSLVIGAAISTAGPSDGRAVPITPLELEDFGKICLLRFARPNTNRSTNRSGRTLFRSSRKG
jgi:hypothetical protein